MDEFAAVVVMTFGGDKTQSEYIQKSEVKEAEVMQIRGLNMGVFPSSFA